MRITQRQSLKSDIDKYVASYSAPGGMRAGFEYYRAFPVTLEQNKEHANVKLPMPVLALVGSIVLALLH